MDESKDHEPKAGNMSESTVTMTTIITTTSTESVIEDIVEEEGGENEEEPTEGEDVGDVMVEVLGSEVLVDGVRRLVGEAGCDELGGEQGDAGGGDNLGARDGGGVDGDRDGGGEVDDTVVMCDEVLSVRPGDQASCGAEIVAGEPGREGTDGNGISLGSDGVQESEAHDRDEENVVETVVEGDLEKNLGTHDGGGEVDDTVVMHDGVSSLRPGDQASCGAQNLASEPDREGTSDGVQESEAHECDEEKVEEKKLDDEGGVTSMELTDAGNGSYGELGSHDVEVRINQIENGAQHSLSQVSSMTDGNKDVGSQQYVESVNDEGDDEDSKVLECHSTASESMSKEPVVLEKGDEQESSKPDSHSQGNEILEGTVNRNVEFVEVPNVESVNDEGDDKHCKVVECPSTASESMSKEPVVLEKGEEQGSSEPDSQSQGNEILDGTVNRDVEFVEAPNGDDRSSCIDSSNCSSVDLNSLRSEVKSVPEGDTCDNIPRETGKDGAKVIDSMTRDSETYNPVLSDTQAQVIVEEKNGNSVDDQQMDSLGVKIDKNTANHRVGDQELQSEAGVLNVQDNGIVNEEPESSVGTETGYDRKLTAASDKKVSENDGEVQCCELEQKPVTYSDIDQNLMTEPVSYADMRSTDESFFPCGEEAGKMDMEVVLEVKDGAPKMEILQCVKDDKSDNCNMSSDPDTQANVEGNAMEIDDVDHYGNQKDDKKIKLDGTEESDVLHPQLACRLEGNSVVGMDIDADYVNSKEKGVSGADHQHDSKSNSALVVENQVSEAILYAKSGEVGPTVPSLDPIKEVIDGCNFTPTSASFNNHFGPVSSCVTEFMDSASSQSKNVKVKNASGNEDETARLTDPVADATLGDEVTQGDDKIHKMDGERNTGSSILETEVLDDSIAGSKMADSDVDPRPDTNEESQGRDTLGQPPFPGEPLLNSGDQGLKCEPVTCIGECLDKSATDGVAQVGASAEDIHEIQEEPANPDVSIAGNSIAHTDGSPRQDTDACEQPCFQDELLVDCVDRGLKCEPETSIGNSIADTDAGPRQDTDAHEQPPFPVELLVNSVDGGVECEPETSIGEFLDKSVTDRVAQVGSSAEAVQEMQEEPANPDISIEGNSIMDTDVGPKHDTYAHEQPPLSPLSDELLGNCVDQGLKCELEIRTGECLDKSAIDDAQAGTSSEVVQEMQEEPTDPDVSIAGNCIGNTDAGPTQDTDAHEQPPLADESLDNCVDEGVGCEPETKIGEFLDKSATDYVAQVDSIAEDVQEMQEQPADPDVSIEGNSIVNTDAGPTQDTDAHEQPALSDESLDICVDQGLKCEPETPIGECLDKSATDDVAQVGSSAEDVQEMQELSNPNVSIEGKSNVDMDAGPKQDTDSHEQPPFSDELLVNCETSVGECLDQSVTDGAAQVGSNADDFQEMQEQPAVPGPEQDTDAHEPHPLPEESLINCVDQQLEFEQDSVLGECLDKNPTDGFAQADSSVEDIQEMHEQASNATQDVSMEENITKLYDPVTSVVVDKQVMHIGDKIHDVDEKLCDVDDSYTSPGQDRNEEFEGNVAHEQPSLPNESPVRVSDQGVELEPDTSSGKCLDKSDTNAINMEEGVHEIQEGVITQQVEFLEKQEVDEDLVSGSAKPRSKDEKNARRVTVKSGSFIRDHRITYQLPPETEGDFSVFDLVWGKVKSHPWWPGQIFHPSDSSEKAMKYYRKDCYLVAYFGDRSFAWNEASVLKPFRKHFSQEEKQSNTESFQNAVNCALAEVSRRLELGLACSCISESAYDKIKYQFVENAGIREESSKREGVDRSTGPDTFQSANLVDYVRALALFPTSGADRFDLVIAKAQLLTFNRLNGCDALAEFQYYDGLMGYDVETSVPGQSDAQTKLKGPHKRKHNLKDIVYQRRKEKSLTELMGETMYCFDGEFDSHEEDDIMLSSPTSGSKRKASDYLSDDMEAQQSTKTISFAKVSHTTSSNPQQSFKVGECIRRVASQLTGSPSIIKSTSDEVIDTPDDSLTESTVISPKQSSSPEELLSLLHLSARDPMKGRFSFLGEIICFFSEFRNVAVSAQRQRMRKGGPGRKRKPISVFTVGSPETFEFDDKNDSYWTDMVVSEAKPALRRGRKRKDQIVVAVDSEKPVRSNRRKYSRKQYFHGNHELTAEIPSGPTELMLNFSDVGSIPSQPNLNKMFRRFGSLKESETEVDAQSSRARVVFKKRSDAEIAYSSAAMFNIFGPTLVNYQLNYTPSVSFGTPPPLALSDTTEHHAT